MLFYNQSALNPQSFDSHEQCRLVLHRATSRNNVLLMNQVFSRIPFNSEEIGEALILAARVNATDAAAYLLRHHGKNIVSDLKAKALLEAAKQGASGIVALLLNEKVIFQRDIDEAHIQTETAGQWRTYLFLLLHVSWQRRIKSFCNLIAKGKHYVKCFLNKIGASVSKNDVENLEADFNTSITVFPAMSYEKPIVSILIKAQEVRKSKIQRVTFGSLDTTPKRESPRKKPNPNRIKLK